mmetsp:Transcript_52006/g.95219  ORF Transcript_52006/g.95219 Transcript_52006/m.95219 type:complete len:95 (-) Transcript_52006:201-485(-)
MHTILQSVFYVLWPGHVKAAHRDESGSQLVGMGSTKFNYSWQKCAKVFRPAEAKQAPWVGRGSSRQALPSHLIASTAAPCIPLVRRRSEALIGG